MSAEQLPIDGIDVSGLDEAELLAALYNAAKPLGMGIYHYDPSHHMSTDEAREIIESERTFMGGWWVDYVKGRPIKVAVLDGTLTGGWVYDCDQGLGKCASIVEQLRSVKR